MTGIAILVAGAAVAFAVCRWTGLPSIPLLLLAGLGLALAGLLPRDLLQDAVVLGVTFLVFAAGIELNLRRVGRQRRAAFQVGVAQFLLLGLAGFLVALALGLGTEPSLYVAVALTASSTLVVVRLLQRRRQMFEPFGRLVIGVLLVQDLAVILIIPVLGGLSQGPRVVALGLAGVLGLMGLAYACVRWVTPYLILRLKLGEELLLLVALAFLFVFSGLASALGLPWIAGAFLAGVSLSPFPVSGLVRGQLRSLSDFFVAVLFTALGGLLVLPSPEQLLQALALALAVVLLTPPLVTLLAERAGLSARAAIESGLLLSQTSEFSLIVALQGLFLGRIGPEVFTIVALVTVLTMILTPFLATDRMAWTLMRLHPSSPSRGRAPVEEPPRGHILFLGCGENTLPLLETLVAVGHDVVVVDDDPAIIERLIQGDVPCIRGDASDPAALSRAGARRARLIVSTVRRPSDNETVLDWVGNEVPVLVRVFEPEAAERLRARGATPVLYSEAAAEEFLEWFDAGGVEELARKSGTGEGAGT